ncbi:MAG: hypothetical protein HY930_03795 [Euryarchaeota archaeon]|nr:hypothetical protein [Euryarchaeota archaeon]
MEIKHILLKSLFDYRKNLKFVLPHAIEYLLDAAVFFIAVAALFVIGFLLPSLAVEDLEALYTQVSFFAIAFIIFSLLVFILLLIFFNSAARAVIIGMAGESFHDRRAALSKGLESAKKHGLEIFLFQILLGATYVALVLAALLSVKFLAKGNFFLAAAGLLIFLICFSIFFLFYILTLFVPQEVVLRERGLIEGFRGSFLFVRKHFKAVISYGAAASVVIVSVGVLFMGIGFLGAGKLFAKILQNLFALIVGLVVAPYFEIVKTYMVAGEAHG